MIEVASLIVVNLVIAALIGSIIGYLVGKNSLVVKKKDNKSDIKASSKTAINPIFKKGSNLDYKPPVLSSSQSNNKDNLKKIKGINTEIEKELNTLGIYHFEQISNWSSKNCDWIESFLLKAGCAKENNWVEQAKILKSGKETIYSQKVENGEIKVD